MSTIITCDAQRCRHHEDGHCSKDAVTLANADFTYLSFEAVGGWQTSDGDEQF